MYRLVDTTRWSNCGWFMDLSHGARFLYSLYMELNCDDAGFLHINFPIIQITTGFTQEQAVLLLDEIPHHVSKENDLHVWLPHFLDSQRKLPLNSKNNAHIAIIQLLTKNVDHFPAGIDQLIGHKTEKKHSNPSDSKTEERVISVVRSDRYPEALVLFQQALKSKKYPQFDPVYQAKMFCQYNDEREWTIGAGHAVKTIEDAVTRFCLRIPTKSQSVTKRSKIDVLTDASHQTLSATGTNE